MPSDRIVRTCRAQAQRTALAGLVLLLLALAGCAADPRVPTPAALAPPAATLTHQLPAAAPSPNATPAPLRAAAPTAQPPSATSGGPGLPTREASRSETPLPLAAGAAEEAAPPPPPGREPPALPVLGSLGGNLGALAIAAPWAYLAEGQGLTVLDVHDPGQPQARGRLALAAAIQDLAVAPGRVYVAAGEQGLLIVNVAEPTRPVLAGRVAPSPLGYTQGVQVRGDRAYVVDGTGLRIVDVHDGSQPVLRGSLDLVALGDASSWAVRVQVVGSFAYVALSLGGLAVVDIQDPVHPVLLGRYTARFVPTPQTHGSPGRVGSLHVVGHLAYLAAGYAGLEIVDVADPAQPVLRGSHDAAPREPVVDVQVVAGRAYLVTAPNSAWGPDAPRLEVVAVDQPAHPASCGSLALPRVPVRLAVGNGYAYVMSAADLTSWNLALPCQPAGRGHYAPLGPARDVQVVDGMAYVATSAGLQVVDVRDPARPALRGRTGPNAVAVQVAGARAYVAAGDAGLAIVDVRDPDAPRVLGRVQVPGAGGMQVMGGYAYLACGMQGVQIVDIRDPLHPQVRGRYNWPHGEVHSVQVVGSTAYVADDFAGLQILDVHDPAHPVALGGYNEPGLTPFGQVSGPFGYFMGQGLQILDLHDPAHPVRAASYRPSEWTTPSEVQVAGGRGYVLDLAFPAYQVHILDLTHPTTPAAQATYRVLALHEAPRASIGWRVVGQLVYIVGADEGLQIVQLPQ